MFRCLQPRFPACGSLFGVQTSFLRLCSSDMIKKVSELVKKDNVVIFMKGTPNEPRCGFSYRAVSLLNIHGVKFQYYNVLEDNNLRQGIKEFTKWPTIPQIFFQGVFIGGYDILKQKHLNGELISDLKNIGITSKQGKDEKDNLQVDESK